MANHVDVEIFMTRPLFNYEHDEDMGDVFISVEEGKKLRADALEKLNAVSDFKFVEDENVNLLFRSENYWGGGFELMNENLKKLMPYLKENYLDEFVVRVGFGYGPDYSLFFVKD